MTPTLLIGADLRRLTDHAVARLVVPDAAPAAALDDGSSWAALHAWTPGSDELGGSAVGPRAQECVDALFAAASASDLDRLAWFGWERGADVVLPPRWRADPDHGGDWDFMSGTAFAETWLQDVGRYRLSPGRHFVRLHDAADADEIIAFNALHNPHSEGRPGEGVSESWTGVRDDAGMLLAVGAVQRLAAGTPYLAGLVVHRDVRREGLGATVMHEMARQSFELGTEVCFGVDAANAGALALYRRMGFGLGMAFRSEDFVVEPRPVIRVAAVAVRDVAGRVLAVRKRGTDHFMQPGGKPESGESFVAAAVRELGEELGLVVDASELEPTGAVDTDAANEAGHALAAHCFSLRRRIDPADVVAAAEIAELRWFDADELLHPVEGLRVAPLLRDHVAPSLR